MFEFIRSHKATVTAAGAVASVAIAWLAFGYFGVHTLFVDDEVSEAVPVFAAPAAPADPADLPHPADEAPATDAEGNTSVADDALAASSRADVGSETTTRTATEAGSDTTVAITPQPEIVTEYSGSFTSGAHPTSGTAVVLGNGTNQRFLRFEAFETDNGPDLNVYLVNSSTGDVSDYVDLGDLKGNIGEQNYEIPDQVDLDVYDQVVIWCVRFGVGFGDAELIAS